MRHLVCLLGVFSGCATLSNLESAQTLDKGVVQVALEGRALMTRADLATETNIWPSVAVRYGVLDGFELGLRAGGRPEVFGKWRLHLGEKLAVSLSETLGVWRWDGNVAQWQGWSRTALPIGIRFTNTELVISPQIYLALARADANLWAFNVTPSASLGFIWWPIRWLGLMPQVSFGYAVATVSTHGNSIGGGIALEAGLAILGGGLHGW